jgi:hypothetical protein
MIHVLISVLGTRGSLICLSIDSVTYDTRVHFSPWDAQEPGGRITDHQHTEQQPGVTDRGIPTLSQGRCRRQLAPQIQEKVTPHHIYHVFYSAADNDVSVCTIDTVFFFLQSSIY